MNLNQLLSLIQPTANPTSTARGNTSVTGTATAPAAVNAQSPSGFQQALAALVSGEGTGPESGNHDGGAAHISEAGNEHTANTATATAPAIADSTETLVGMPLTVEVPAQQSTHVVAASLAGTQNATSDRLNQVAVAGVPQGTPAEGNAPSAPHQAAQTPPNISAGIVGGQQQPQENPATLAGSAPHIAGTAAGDVAGEAIATRGGVAQVPSDAAQSTAEQVRQVQQQQQQQQARVTAASVGAVPAEGTAITGQQLSAGVAHGDAPKQRDVPQGKTTPTASPAVPASVATPTTPVNVATQDPSLSTNPVPTTTTPEVVAAGAVNLRTSEQPSAPLLAAQTALTANPGGSPTAPPVVATPLATAAPVSQPAPSDASIAATLTNTAPAATTPVATTAPPNATPQGLPDPNQPMPQQVLAKLNSAVRNLGQGTHEFAVRVNPESLGPVRVVATITEGQLSVELQSASAAGRDLLRAAMPDLRRDFVAPGLTTSLDVGAEEGSAQQQHTRDTNSQQGRSMPQRQGSPVAGETNAAEPELNTHSAAQEGRVHQGRVDIVT